MTAPGAGPGERFRRSALKRGYKTDEVDDFLDRVADTLLGRARGGAVTAEDVREVVFRVRFGGYDEWQVDKHLDRLERQVQDLADAAAERADQDRPTQVVPAIREPVRGVPAAPAGTAYGAPSGGGVVPPGVPAPTSAGDGRTASPAFADPDTAWAAGRHGKADMTMEMPQYGPGSVYTPADATRIAELRATFKPRRFGSGYAPAEVDRLFDGIAAVVTGRSGGSMDAGDLDSSQFELVQGGYFEDEVDAALREVRDMMSRRGS
jgi:DivIVA domain-containing protein